MERKIRKILESWLKEVLQQIQSFGVYQTLERFNRTIHTRGLTPQQRREASDLFLLDLLDGMEALAKESKYRRQLETLLFNHSVLIYNDGIRTANLQMGFPAKLSYYVAKKENIRRAADDEESGVASFFRSALASVGIVPSAGAGSTAPPPSGGGAAVASSPPPVEITAGLTDPEVIFQLENRTLVVGARTSVATIKEARKLIKDVIILGGGSVRDVEKALFATGGMPVWKAKQIARTEMHSMYEQAMYDTYLRSGVQYMSWITVGDHRVRPEHSTNEAHGPVKLGDEFPNGAIHPGEEVNCILPGNKVSARVEAATRSWYEGQAIEIKTLSGRRVTVTPNHFVFSKDGRVRASSLQKGQKIFAHIGSVEDVVGTSSNGDKKDNAPVEIEKIFEAFSLEFQSLNRRVSPHDFDGDAGFFDGEVEIVGSDRILRAVVDPSFGKTKGNVHLIGVDSVPVLGISGSSFDLSLEGVRHTSTSLLSSPSLISSLGGRHLGPLDKFGFGSSTGLDTPFLKPSHKSDADYASFLADLQQRFPGEMLFDEIVEIRNFNFTGHVYDLQTDVGYMVAEGVVVSNCRCTLEPDLADPSILLESWQGGPVPMFGGFNPKPLGI